MSRLLAGARTRLSRAPLLNLLIQDADKEPVAEAPEPASPAKDISKGMESIRENLRTFGTALGALATAVLAGVGFATFHEIFPLPPGRGLLGVGAALLAAAAVGGTVWLTAAFFAAQRRIVFSPSALSVGEEGPVKAEGLSKHEENIIKAILKEHAAEEGGASLRAVEMRAQRLSRVARRVEAAGAGEAARAAAITKESQRLTEAVSLAAWRAALMVLENRARRVYKGTGTVIALCVAATGIVGLLLLADYSKGQRDLIALRESCAKAVTAGAANACDDFGRQPTPPPATADLGILQRLAECTREAETGTASAAIPAALREEAIARCAGLPTPAAGEEDEEPDAGQGDDSSPATDEAPPTVSD